MFIICWKLLFLCKSWLILSALILLLFNCLNFIYTFLFRFYSNLFALSTFVDLRIFLLKYLAQILLKSYSDLFAQIYLLCQHLLTWESSYSNILLRSCLNLAQILLRFYSNILLKSCLNLFALLIFIDLRIFLLRSELSKIFEQEVYFASYILLLVSCFILTL